MIDAGAAADLIERAARDNGTPERAAGEKAYLKSDLDHLGAGMPALRRIVKDFASDHRDIGHAELTALVTELWSRPIHECRMAAIMLLEQHRRLLGERDLALIESMIRGSLTWAYVDSLAGDLAGSLVALHPEAVVRLDRWSTDPNFWIRRSALLAMMAPLKQGAGFERFGRYADAMLDEKEFFIRKAIGWVLRETGKRRPDEVVRWLLPRANRASGVTLREAVKYLDAADRDSILRAARHG